MCLALASAPEARLSFCGLVVATRATRSLPEALRLRRRVAELAGQAVDCEALGKALAGALSMGLLVVGRWWQINLGELEPSLERRRG